jgi:hypothetical protein
LLILYTKLTSKRIFTTHPNLTATTDSLGRKLFEIPDFLTKVYRNENITVVNSDINTDKIYKIDKIIEEKRYPFDGLIPRKYYTWSYRWKQSKQCFKFKFRSTNNR